MKPFTYRARLDRVIDGDTVDLFIDLGFRLYAHMRIRLEGVDTPERGEDDYDRATAIVEDWMTETIASTLDSEWHLVVATGRESGSFDRWLGTIWAAEIPGAPSLNTVLAAHGWSSE